MKTFFLFRLQSLGNAFRGFRLAVQTEPHLILELLFLLVAVVAGWLLQLDTTEWLAVILCATAVIALELLNTAVERTCNLVSPGFHPQVKIIKDIAAAAVLVAAFGSAVVALLIFIPRIQLFIHNF